MHENSVKINQKQRAISTEEYLMKKGLLYQNSPKKQIKPESIPQNCIAMELEMLYVQITVHRKNHQSALTGDRTVYKHIKVSAKESQLQGKLLTD